MIEIKNVYITKTQVKTLRKMKLGIEYCACDLDVSIFTLNNLKYKKLLESRNESESPFLPRLHKKFKLIDKIKVITYSRETRTWKTKERPIT